MRKLLFFSVFVLGLVYTQATGRLECVPNYVKCRNSASTEEQRDDCVWKFVNCIKEDCDTHVCDGYGKKCLEAATTHEGKHVCAGQWFRCVQKMHREICHTKKTDDITTLENSVTYASGRVCEKAYIKCRKEATSEEDLDKCLWKFVYCIKEDCDTHVCDATGKQCLEDATTHAAKHVCAFNWFKCVEKMHVQICHVKEPEGISLSENSVTYASGRVCEKAYIKCRKEATSEEDLDKCLWKFVYCIKEDCDTHVCDATGKQCLKDAPTHAAKHVCAFNWFKCVEKMHVQICRVKEPERVIKLA